MLSGWCWFISVGGVQSKVVVSSWCRSSGYLSVPYRRWTGWVMTLKLWASRFRIVVPRAAIICVPWTSVTVYGCVSYLGFVLDCFCRRRTLSPTLILCGLTLALASL